MTSPEPTGPRAARGRAGAPVALLLLALLMPAAPAVAEGADAALLEATPLILKDGRIANVSVHVLPFRRGHAEFAPGALAGLSRVVTDVATDCFLTAQVIGHVSPDELDANDTLAAHRLARSRADSVQASLIDGGLPAKSIASVWDWQFLVRQARATLWVFRLNQGEDCDGSPLAPGAAGLVAQTAPEVQATPQTREPAARAAPAPPLEVVQPPAVARAGAAPTPTREAQTATPARDAQVAAPAREAQVAAPAREAPQPVRAAGPVTSDQGTLRAATGPATQATTPGRASAERSVAEAAPGRAAPGREARASEPAPAEPARPALAAAPAGPARAATGAPVVTQAIPAASRAAPPSEGAAPAKDTGERDQRLAAIPARDTLPDPGGDGPSLAITFATNSSYFPPGTGKELERLVRAVEAGKRYRVQLVASVAAGERVTGANSPEEAALYNRWLAERRLTRVQEWLENRFKAGEIEIEPAFLARDDSRRVLVRLVPAG